MANPERKLVKQLTRLVRMASLERRDRAVSPPDGCASWEKKRIVPAS